MWDSLELSVPCGIIHKCKEPFFFVEETILANNDLYNCFSFCKLMAISKKKMEKCSFNKTVLHLTSVTRYEMHCMSNGM
jgi:hypothetical protein